MKSFSSKLFFMSKSDSEKFTQISSEGATEIISAVLTGL